VLGKKGGIYITYTNDSLQESEDGRCDEGEAEEPTAELSNSGRSRARVVVPTTAATAIRAARSRGRRRSRSRVERVVGRSRVGGRVDEDGVNGVHHPTAEEDVRLGDLGGRVGELDKGAGAILDEGQALAGGVDCVVGDQGRVRDGTVEDVLGEQGLELGLVELGRGRLDGLDGSIGRREDGEPIIGVLEELGLGEELGELGEVAGDGEDRVDGADEQVAVLDAIQRGSLTRSSSVRAEGAMTTGSVWLVVKVPLRTW